MATWYAAKNQKLATVNPVTLWLSLNGADSANSIEIVPGTHKMRLEPHVKIKGQGRFRLKQFSLNDEPSVIVECEAGQGIMINQMTVHRSVPDDSLPRPRYSFDIRYFSSGNYAPYDVAPSMRLRRVISAFI